MFNANHKRLTAWFCAIAVCLILASVLIWSRKKVPTSTPSTVSDAEALLICKAFDVPFVNELTSVHLLIVHGDQYAHLCCRMDFTITNSGAPDPTASLHQIMHEIQPEDDTFLEIPKVVIVPWWLQQSDIVAFQCFAPIRDSNTSEIAMFERSPKAGKQAVFFSVFGDIKSLDPSLVALIKSTTEDAGFPSQGNISQCQWFRTAGIITGTKIVKTK